MRIFLLAAIAAFFISTSYSQQYESVDVPEPLSRVYVSPGGSGDQSGADIDNAMPVSVMWTEIDSAVPGTAFTLLAGEYSVNTTHNLVPQGTIASPIYIESYQSDEVVFIGTYDLDDGTDGVIPFLLHSGNIVIRGLNVRNVRYAVGTKPGTHVDNAVIESININAVSECINIDRDSDSTPGVRAATNWVISNIYCTDYYRAGIRVYSGDDAPKTENILIRNIHAETCINRQEGATQANKFVAAVQIGEGASNVIVEDSLFINNLGECRSVATNGDGIALETRDHTHSITIRDIDIRNAGDACIDSKTENTIIENVSCRGANYGFKFWYFDDQLCDGCQSADVRVSHMHLLSGASPMFTGDSVFWCSDDSRVINSDNPTSSSGATIQNAIAVDIDQCEPDPANNYNAPNNDLSGLAFGETDANGNVIVTYPSLSLPVENPDNPTYRVQ